ncbi:MAG: hypothetical protein OEN02_03945 [Gammaproteobacteria bacterium]|nr:hypothetical protein [Gammaproteobacteria bacterium]
MKRRTLLQAGIQVSLGAILFPRAAIGAYPSGAFLAKELPQALREAFGSADIGDSDKIEIEAPLIARDPGMVPVRIRSGFANTESIAIVVASNESPFTAHFRLYESQDFVSTRVRMAATGDLVVIVKADGVLHANRRPVRVGRNSCEV